MQMSVKKVCVLHGALRADGNTENLLMPFMDEIEKEGAICRMIKLSDSKILPCTACRECQKNPESFGCSQDDDMQKIFDEVMECDLLLLATPVYSWYCTPPMKAALDRLVYGMNKYYGGDKPFSLWKGKSAALLTTCGYTPEKGADLLDEGLRRYCRHSGLKYLGMLAERHMGYDTVFMDEEKEKHSRQFARRLLFELG